MCGVPLIAADNRGTREYAHNGHNSIVCKYDKEEEFQKAIELLSGNSDMCRRLADSCRNSAKIFSVEEVEKTMRKVYEKALKSRKEENRE